MSRFSFLLLLLLLPVLATSAPTDRRVALVIGNAIYSHDRTLENPRRDALAIALMLRELGFEVTELHDLTRPSFRHALRRFAADARSAQWAFVYYAGHGVQVGGVNYLVPVDARLGSIADLDQAIDLGAVMAAAGGARQLALVVLDACRDNPFSGRMNRRAGRSVAARGFSVVPRESLPRPAPFSGA